MAMSSLRLIRADLNLSKGASDSQSSSPSSPSSPDFFIERKKLSPRFQKQLRPLQKDKEALEKLILEKNARIKELEPLSESNATLRDAVNGLTDLIQYQKAQVKQITSDLHMSKFESAKLISGLRLEVESLRNQLAEARRQVYMLDAGRLSKDSFMACPENKEEDGSSDIEFDGNTTVGSASLGSDDTLTSSMLSGKSIVSGSDMSLSMGSSCSVDLLGISSDQSIISGSASFAKDSNKKKLISFESASQSSSGIKSILKRTTSVTKLCTSDSNGTSDHDDLPVLKHRLITRLQEQRKSVSFESLTTVGMNRRTNPPGKDGAKTSSTDNIHNRTFTKKIYTTTTTEQKKQISAPTIRKPKTAGTLPTTSQTDASAKSANQPRSTSSRIRANIKVTPQTQSPLRHITRSNSTKSKESSTSAITSGSRVPCGVINENTPRRPLMTGTTKGGLGISKLATADKSASVSASNTSSGVSKRSAISTTAKSKENVTSKRMRF